MYGKDCEMVGAGKCDIDRKMAVGGSFINLI